MNAPKKGVWALSLVLGVISILSYFSIIPGITGTAVYWIGITAWALLLLATYFKGF